MFEFLVLALVVAAITFVFGNIVLDILGTSIEDRNPKSAKKSGVEAAPGQFAIVIREFTDDDGARLLGRVRFEGEDWRAAFVGDTDSPPSKGGQVTVVEIDTDRLEIRVQ